MEGGVPDQQKEVGKYSAAKSIVIAPQTVTVGFGDGTAAALNAIRTGEGEKNSFDSGKACISKAPGENLSCNDLQLEYVKPVINNVNGSVIIPSDVVNRGSIPYSRTLYGYFFEEKEIDFSLINSHFRNMWKIHGIEDIMVNNKGFYFFRFKSDEGMLDALEHGPWIISNSNSPIFLKRWTPGLILDKSKHDKLKLPVWIRIYDMPLELWNKNGLNIIASMLGIPLAVDSCTARMCMNASGRAGHARVLVDFEATGKWPDEISVSVPCGNGFSLSTLRIEYSWKPDKCSFCKVFDHSDSNCIQHNEIRLKKEQKKREEKRRYQANPHLYTIIKVARDEDLLEQIGSDIYFDLVDHDKAHCFYVKKETPFNLFKEEVAKEFGVPVQFQRFWFWAKRQNHTYRPNRPVTAQEETQYVNQLRKLSNKDELKLFLEIEIGPNLHPLPPPKKKKNDILVFFKLYDPEKEQLRYVGRFFVKKSGKPREIISKLNERAGFSPVEEIELYEEIKFKPNVMCERLDKRTSFRSSQIEDGDIICFQKLSQARAVDKYRYPDVPSFLEYVKNRQIVHFRSLDRPKEDDFCLQLSKLHTYDDVTERVAGQIGVDDPSKIRLTLHNCYSQQPKPHPIKFRVAEHLLDMLVHYNQDQAVEELQGSRFTWKTENFSQQANKKLYSDVFVVGDFKWRMLIFPKGNKVDHLSMYLDVADSRSLPYGWSRYAQFSLSVVNQIHNRSTIKKDTQHQFHEEESDWGFTSFMALNELYDPRKGFIVNDTCIIEAHIVVEKVVLGIPVHYSQVSDILYYEVLEIPLPELQCLKTLKVAFHHSTKEEPVIHIIRLPKQSTVGDVLNEIKTKVELSHPDAELRLLQVFYPYIYKIFPVTEKIENINDEYWTLRAEEILEEEKNMGAQDRLIQVCHFTKNTAHIQQVLEPFLLIIHENETLAAVKVRIQKKLDVPDDEFSKWKFAYVCLERPKYLQDSDVVSSRFQTRDLYQDWEQYLGLEHSDTT